MKRVLTIAVVLLMIMITGSACHTRQQRERMKEYAELRAMRNGRGPMSDTRMWGMRRRMGHEMRGDMMNDSRPGMGHMGPGMGMTGRMRPMPNDSIGWMHRGQESRILASVPDVTVNQKKQIEELMKKHQDEMKKMNEEFYSKVQSMRDSHRKEMLNILTPEQKNFLESEKSN